MFVITYYKYNPTFGMRLEFSTKIVRSSEMIERVMSEYYWDFTKSNILNDTYIRNNSDDLMCADLVTVRPAEVIEEECLIISDNYDYVEEEYSEVIVYPDGEYAEEEMGFTGGFDDAEKYLHNSSDSVSCNALKSYIDYYINQYGLDEAKKPIQKEGEEELFWDFIDRFSGSGFYEMVRWLIEKKICVFNPYRWLFSEDGHVIGVKRVQ